MAGSAADRSRDPSRWRDLLEPTPERVQFAARLALICALTTLITEVYQTPDAALTAYVAFFLNRPERTVSIILSIAFTLVISIVIGLVFLVAREVADDPMLRIISMTTISFGLLFLVSASKLRPIAGTVALIIAYALDLLGTIQVGELATRGFLYAWLFVAIPAGVSVVVNLLFAPAPRTSAQQTMARRLEVSAASLRSPADPIAPELRTLVYEGNAPTLTLLELAKKEKSASAADLACLHQAAISSWAITNAVLSLESNSARTLSIGARRAIADTLDNMAAILRQGGYPVEVSLDWPAENESLASSAAVFEELRDSMTGFAKPLPQPPQTKPKEGGFLAADAFSNPEHVQYALKTTGAAMFCYLLYSLLDWPGIHTAFLTCYIVAQATAAESVEKLTLRIVGCLLGAAVGIGAIVYLIPYLTTIDQLMIAVFVGALGAAYVAAGSPRVSYAGFQIAFAFFLCVIQGPGPSLDMVTARDRIIGILLGNLVAYIAFVYIWPVTVTRRIDPALAAAFRNLGRVAMAKSDDERRLDAATTQSSLTAIDSDVALASYEPAAIRFPEEWLAVREAIVEEAHQLGVSLTVRGSDTHLGSVPATLERLAEALERPPDQREPIQGPDQSPRDPQSEEIAEHLRKLIHSITPDLSTATAHAPV